MDENVREAIKKEEDEEKRKKKKKEWKKHLTHLFKILNRKKKYFKSHYNDSL